MELLYRRPAALAGRYLFHLHDLDGVGTGTMPGPHVSVCGEWEGAGQGECVLGALAFPKHPVMFLPEGPTLGDRVRAIISVY